jgi:O-antigen/teichoic acid export membrane protein
VSLKRNLVANYLGQAWRVLMGFAFLPLYIKYLGMEAYGLIGIFAILQAWLALLDMGMRPALGRELARFTAGAHDARSIRDLLRTVEVLGIAGAATVAIAIWLSSGWLAANWVTAKSLPVPVVAQAFTVMGFVTALRLIENIYVTSIASLQQQVLENVVTGTMATARSLGSVGILAWVSATLEAFFLWQAVVSVMTTAILSALVYNALPGVARPARFSWPSLRGIWRFTAGMMAINLLALLLTQLDKILLSRLLDLEAFGYYVFAATVAGALPMLAVPITNAYFPRFAELAARANQSALNEAYHQAAQLVTVLIGAAAIALVLFGERLLWLWTANATLVLHAAPLLAVLALGTLLHALIWIPYQVQLAHGWTLPTIRISTVAVLVLTPVLLWLVPKHGAIAAAWIWVVLNAGGLLCHAYVVFGRLMPTERRRWYRHDVALPLAAALASGGLCYWAIPTGLNRLGELVAVFVSCCLMVMATALAAPLIRSRIWAHARLRFGVLQ